MFAKLKDFLALVFDVRQTERAKDDHERRLAAVERATGGATPSPTYLVVRGGSYGTEQAAVTVPSNGGGTPKFTLGYALVKVPIDGTWTVKQFAARLGSEEGPNMTLSDNLDIKLVRVTGTGAAVVSTISYTVADGARGQKAKSNSLSIAMAADEELYIAGVGVFPDTTLSTGPISWEVLIEVS